MEIEIHRVNLTDALTVAIGVQSTHEKEKGYDAESALLAGWKELRQAILDGKQIILK